MKFHKTIYSLRICFLGNVHNKLPQHWGQYTKKWALKHPTKLLLHPHKCKWMWSLIGCVLGVDKYFALTVREMWDLNVMRWYFTTPVALWFWAENTSLFLFSCSCWLSLEGGLLYAFVGPAAVIVLVSPSNTLSPSSRSPSLTGHIA